MPLARISYTAKDYEAIRKQLIERIPTITDRWTDFNQSDLGMTLLELFCGVADMLCFYLDNQANEAYLPTARQRQNVINLAALVNYRLDRPVAATTMLHFALSTALGYHISIPKGARCRAATENGNVDFVTLETVTIPAGTLSKTVGAVQGVPVQEQFQTNGQPDQTLTLVNKKIAEGYLEVWIDGVRWSEVRTFYDSASADKHFIVTTDALDSTKVTLGDGNYGFLPPAGRTVLVKFLETKAAAGNIGKYLVNTLLDPVYHEGQLVKLAVTNIETASGGGPREALDHARTQAPAEIATLWRAVTKSDYVALAEGFPGVAKAQVLDVNDCINLGYYHVCVVIAPDGGGLPSQTLKQQVKAFLDERKLLTVTVHVKDPVFIPANINATIYVYRTHNRSLVEDAVRQRIRDFLAFENVSFGQDIYFSDIVALIDSTEGVSHVVMTNPKKDLVLGPGDLPYEGHTVINSTYVST